MATFERDGVILHYEQYGEGFPVLLLAPGGLRSSIEFWDRTPWDPRKELGGDFKVIAMDQRNAGESRAPVLASDGWQVYTADHLALLDHLRIERCHVVGGCIGGSFCLGLMQAAPSRITAAVLQQPIGFADNRDVFEDLFDGWAAEKRETTPDVTDEVWNAFKSSMFGGDFVFSVPRDFVAGCRTPLLVLMGNDVYHPTGISREIVKLAPDAELIEKWKEPESVAPAVHRVRMFLRRHTPI